MRRREHTIPAALERREQERPHHVFVFDEEQRLGPAGRQGLDGTPGRLFTRTRFRKIQPERRALLRFALDADRAAHLPHDAVHGREPETGTRSKFFRGEERLEDPALCDGVHPDARSVLAAARREVAVVPRPDYDRFMHAFGHVFAGGYAAGYYSYKWAEVLSADAFSLFEEVGVLSPAAGARFRDEVLARGGSRPALESFVAFRGRPPQIDALLRHNGMTMSS